MRGIALVLFGVSSTVTGLGAVAAATDELIDPRELVAELRERRPETGSEISAMLTIRAKGREKQQFAVRLTTRVEPEFWSTRYEIRSASQKESGTVRESAVVTHFGDAPPRYAWESTETTELEAKAGAQFEAGSKESLRPLAGSDFWITDLGLEYLFWPAHRLLGKQTRRTRECYVVESRPARAVEGGYARVVSWIDLKSRQLVRAEAFDNSGKTVKIFKPDEFVYFKGQWRVKQLAIDSPLAGSASYLIFNFRSESIEEKPGGKP